MDADDKKFFNANTPPETNRRKLSDEGRAIIIWLKLSMGTRHFQALHRPLQFRGLFEAGK